jgi:hypothetical protein
VPDAAATTLAPLMLVGASLSPARSAPANAEQLVTGSVAWTTGEPVTGEPVTEEPVIEDAPAAGRTPSATATTAATAPTIARRPHRADDLDRIRFICTLLPPDDHERGREGGLPVGTLTSWSRVPLSGT